MGLSPVGSSPPSEPQQPSVQPQPPPPPPPPPPEAQQRPQWAPPPPAFGDGFGQPPPPQARAGQPVGPPPPPAFDGSAQATQALAPAAKVEAEKLGAAKNQPGQGGTAAAQQSINRLGNQAMAPGPGPGADARGVLTYVASNPAATAGIANDQQVRGAAIQQLRNNFPSLGPAEIRGLADTLGNASPQVGGAASRLLGDLGTGGSPEQQGLVRAELKRIADFGAPAERMAPNDPRRETNADLKAASRATDVLSRMGPPPQGWGADDYRRMLKGANPAAGGRGRRPGHHPAAHAGAEQPGQRPARARPPRPCR